MLGRKRHLATDAKQVDMELAARAFAKAVHDGDIVNLRFLFGPFTPARATSSERFETEKYAYLLPDEEQERSREFQSVLDLVRSRSVWAHIENELSMSRPPQLPSDLVLALGDNALRQGKYTSAAQAYEMLRIRARMQELVLEAADESLDRGDLDDLGFAVDVEKLVLSRARRALEAGCDGVVSSGLEAPMLREFIDHRLLVVTPGIRPVENQPVDDQKRTVDVAQAFGCLLYTSPSPRDP